MVTKKKNLKYYLGLKWSYSIEQDSYEGEDFYIISVNELPGVCTDAATVAEGMKDIQEVLKAVIKLYLKQGDAVPEPISKKKCKGQIAYRTTSLRHFDVARLAKKRHTSISKTIDLLVDVGMEHLNLSPSG